MDLNVNTFGTLREKYIQNVNQFVSLLAEMVYARSQTYASAIMDTFLYTLKLQSLTLAVFLCVLPLVYTANVSYPTFACAILDTN